MEILGIIDQVMDVETGEGRNGTWKKQQFVIATEGEYSKKLCFTVWGDRIDFTIVNKGDKVRVFFDMESREYNSRWYTDAKAWKAERINNDNGTATPTSSDPPVPDVNFTPEEGDDLPF